MSRTCVEVVRDRRGGRVRLEVRTDGPAGRGHLAARILEHGPARARVALVAEGALLLAGDEISIDVHVGAGVDLEVVEPSGTVAYGMRGGSACWRVRAVVDEGATLHWHAETFVVSAGADVHRDVRVDLARRAVALLRETLVLGRAGETGGALTQRTRVDLDGHPLLAEDLGHGPGHPEIGVLRPHRVLDTVSVLGRRAPGIPDLPRGAHLLELAGPGTLVRSLAPDAHSASLRTVWHAVCSAASAFPAAV